MSILSVFDPSSPDLPHKVLTHHEDIAATLAEQGVRFGRWQPGVRLRPGSSTQEVLDACREPLDRLMTEHGSASFAVFSRDGQAAGQADLRDEHVHDSEEVFAVISGRGQVSLRLGGFVYALLCEKDDMLVVPAATRRWLDLGDNPFCLALRLFASEAGAQPRFTGDASARQFLGLDEL
ncbi:oxidase [Pseudomonas muyukensis]|uniref:Oxidase n=1 Tax=Pseudomonas muyukensis TaxID=2842357 RepID=A0ABX8MFW2_9PSED|nr:oxidase [Pseudomonas muyukensis]QXH37136.1 oxidase [Pseudomonas muyukensis]